MQQYLLSLSYDGTDFHGWQIQPNAVTVQAVLNNALQALNSCNSPPLGCSRTDAGVHAAVFCCTVRMQKQWDCAALIRAINGNLPRTVRILTCEKVSGDFHPRYDCISKRYRYQIWNAPLENPFLLRYTHWERRPLDVDKLNELAHPLIGTHDFAAFCASGAGTKTSVRTLKRADFERRGNLLIFRAEADGFLYNMVRILAGTLLQCTMSPEKLAPIQSILESKNRTQAGLTLPPQGLFLEQVKYPHKIYAGDEA